MFADEQGHRAPVPSRDRYSEMTPVGPTRDNVIAQSSTATTAVEGVRFSPTFTTSHSTQGVGAIGCPSTSTTCRPSSQTVSRPRVVLCVSIERLDLEPDADRYDGSR